MDQVIIQTYNRRGKFKFELLQLEIFKILMYELKLCSIRTKKGEFFLEEDLTGYRIVPFYYLKERFIWYIKKNFSSLNLPKEITLEILLNKIYSTKPITKSYARNFFEHNVQLSEEDYIISDISLKFK